MFLVYWLVAYVDGGGESILENGHKWYDEGILIFPAKVTLVDEVLSLG